MEVDTRHQDDLLCTVPDNDLLVVPVAAKAVPLHITSLTLSCRGAHASPSRRRSAACTSSHVTSPSLSGLRPMATHLAGTRSSTSTTGQPAGRLNGAQALGEDGDWPASRTKTCTHRSFGGQESSPIRDPIWSVSSVDCRAAERLEREETSEHEDEGREENASPEPEGPAAEECTVESV
eukprot:CAMPEP_0183441252 /NCGR_PEP_ID=MMETSP0370-20130417/84136_1 /TAXON_ID=268820 /ORGANISM="Peridinium aciculiferum, Strain PAER-2" /LENGTH=178 /DNA_ID=CAMNT_0025630385 /DNA_START=65 /DNA_END=599 /DNA_ORIENTATION=+